MRNYRLGAAASLAMVLAILSVGCQKEPARQTPSEPGSVGTVAAVRLNYRFEPDVPPPAVDASRNPAAHEPAVQADFETNRLNDLLDRTLISPDKQRVIAVYHMVSDHSAEYRLDLYSADGKLLKKLTSDAMAVHFPDTIVWAPDSSHVAFAAMARKTTDLSGLLALTGQMPSPTPPGTPDPDVIDAVPPETVPAEPTPAAPTGILTLNTEQLYLADSDGRTVKPLTLNDGLIYFYFAWSPDSKMLAALAATEREWKYMEALAEKNDDQLIPQGRLRIVERNGRERRLDDLLTLTQPVWSPDSAKVAAAFDTQVRIYDATPINPSQAAIPLRSQLLLASAAYQEAERRQTTEGTDANAAAPAPASPDTLPAAAQLPSFNPIVALAWPSENLLYFETAYIRKKKVETENAYSFSRWHRLALSAQPNTPIR